MTRKILCSKCEEEIRKIVAKFPDEKLVDFVGLALEDFICDDCGVEIPKGTMCYAISILSNGMRQPYQKWEHKFIDIIYSRIPNEE